MSNTVPVPTSKNATIIAKLHSRRKLAWILLFLCVILMPLGCVVPWSLIAVLPKGTPTTVAGISGLVIPLVAVVGTVLMFSDTRRWKYRLCLAHQAENMGFEYVDKPKKADYAVIGETAMFRTTDRHNCEFLLRGEANGQLVIIANYIASRGLGNNAVVYAQTIVILSEAARTLPNFMMTAKGWLNFLEKLLGSKQVDFSDDPAFHKAFIVNGDQEVYHALTPTFRKVSLVDPTVSIEAHAGQLFVYRLKKIQPLERYPDLIAEAFRFADAL